MILESVVGHSVEDIHCHNFNQLKRLVTNETPLQISLQTNVNIVILGEIMCVSWLVCTI